MIMLVVGVVCSPLSSSACAVCVGDPESPLTKGMAAGILTLLGFIGMVLMGISAFFIYVIRRPEAGNLEMAENDSFSGKKQETE